MKSFGLFAILLLALGVTNVLTDCSESECPCGEACVNNKNRWCSNYNDPECSCKKGCLIYNHFISPGDSHQAFCNICHCSEDSPDGLASCTLKTECLPDEFEPGIHYPKWYPNNPNCPKWNLWSFM